MCCNIKQMTQCVGQSLGLMSMQHFIRGYPLSAISNLSPYYNFSFKDLITPPLTKLCNFCQRDHVPSRHKNFLQIELYLCAVLQVDLLILKASLLSVLSEQHNIYCYRNRNPAMHIAYWGHRVICCIFQFYFFLHIYCC